MTELLWDFKAWLEATVPLGTTLLTSTRLELLGFALALAMVVCNIRVNPWAWPLAIVSSLVYALVFSQSKLYGESGLQLFFVAMALWGWWQWLRGSDTSKQALVVRVMPREKRVGLMLVFVLLWLLLAQLLDHGTDTDVPWWDAATTAGSIVATWLLGRKHVENWPVWVAVNAVSTALFMYKNLWLTAALYLVLLVLAGVGWRAWHRLARAKAGGRP
jgi:nicotinamide mononucleotide transporter